MLTFYSYRITSCNMTNRPLFFRYKPAAPLGAEPDTLNDEADGQRVHLQLGFIEETEANHGRLYTRQPSAAFLLHMFHFLVS